MFASHERSDPEQVLARVKERACSGQYACGGAAQRRKEAYFLPRVKARDMLRYTPG